MSVRKATHVASLATFVPIVICLALWCGHWARGQQAVSPNTPVKGAAAPATSRAADDAARKAEILSSDCWRRAMFDFNSWLRKQKVYPPEEVARIRADFSARVEAMSADELLLVQQDLEKKFQILNTPEAQEIRAWLGSYLSVLTERGREGVMRIIPNFDTMNSQQLQQTLGRLGHYRDSRAAQNTQVNALRATKKNPWVTHTPPARRSTPSSGGYSSPFRPSFERPFENTDLNSSRNGTTDPMKWMLLGF